MKARYVQTASILMAASIASRLLGYVRDIVLVAYFGQSVLTDAYYAAFTLPDILYGLVVGGALGPVFIPVFSGYLAKGEEAEGHLVANSAINLVLLAMLAGMGLGFVLAPQMIAVLVPGFAPEAAALAVQMTRIMLLQALFMALSGLAMGILNSYGQYGPSALGSVMYNLGTVVLGVLLTPLWGIMGFAAAVVGGAAAYFFVQVPALWRTSWRWRPQLAWHHPGVRKIRQMLGPILLGFSVNQLNVLVSQNLASTLTGGMLTALRMAQRMMQLPIGIFAINIAIAIFTTMTRQAASGDDSGYKATFRQGLEAIWLLSLPAAAGLVALRLPLSGLLYGVGQNSRQMVEATAALLVVYALGLAAYASLHLLNRAFYALQDTKTPMLIGILAVGVNILLSLLWRPGGQQYGLAAAYTAAGIVNMLLLLALLYRRIGPFGGQGLLKTLLVGTACSLAMLGIVRLLLMLLELGGLDPWSKVGQLIEVALGLAAGVFSYAVFLQKFGGYPLRKLLQRRR